MRRSSIAAKSRRGRTRCGLERSLLCFTGTDVITQSGMSPPLAGSLRQPRITQCTFKLATDWYREAARQVKATGMRYCMPAYNQHQLVGHLTGSPPLVHELESTT